MAEERRYVTLEELLQLAESEGGSIAVRGVGWKDSPSGPYYQAECTVTRGDGRLFTAEGVARVGDRANLDDSSPGPLFENTEDYTEGRARSRAARAALQLAYPRGPEGAVPTYLVELRTLINEAAKALGLTFEQMSASVKATCGVDHTAELTQEQCALACSSLRLILNTVGQAQ